MLQNMMGMVLNRLRQLPEVPGKQMVHTAEVYVKYKIHTEVPAYHIIHNRYLGLKGYQYCNNCRNEIYYFFL